MGNKVSKHKRDRFHRLEQPSLLDWWVERMKAVVAPRRRPAAWTIDRLTTRWPGQLASV
jgi:hypothetical protein